MMSTGKKDRGKTDGQKKRPMELWNAVTRQHDECDVNKDDFRAPYIMSEQIIHFLCRYTVRGPSRMTEPKLLILELEIFEIFCASEEQPPAR